jgi:hypothetical protein
MGGADNARRARWRPKGHTRWNSNITGVLAVSLSSVGCVTMKQARSVTPAKGEASVVSDDALLRQGKGDEPLRTYRNPAANCTPSDWRGSS